MQCLGYHDFLPILVPSGLNNNARVLPVGERISSEAMPGADSTKSLEWPSSMLSTGCFSKRKKMHGGILLNTIYYMYQNKLIKRTVNIIIIIVLSFGMAKYQSNGYNLHNALSRVTGYVSRIKSYELLY